MTLSSISSAYGFGFASTMSAAVAEARARIIGSSFTPHDLFAGTGVRLRELGYLTSDLDEMMVTPIRSAVEAEYLAAFPNFTPWVLSEEEASKQIILGMEGNYYIAAPAEVKTVGGENTEAASSEVVEVAAPSSSSFTPVRVVSTFCTEPSLKKGKQKQNQEDPNAYNMMFVW